MKVLKIYLFIVVTIFTIFKIQAQGVQTFQSIRMYHPSNQGQYITLLPPNAITSYGLTLPTTQGAVNTMLLNDGAGNLSFNDGDALFWRLGGNSQAIQNFGTKTNVDLPFITNNTEKMRLLANGNFGIGTNTPSFKLDVNGSALFRAGNSAAGFSDNQLLFSWSASDQYRHAIKSRHNAGATTDNALDFYLWKQGTDAATTTGTLQVMTLQGNNNGSVGIGITNPQNVLHINNLSAAGDALKISNAATGSLTTDGFDMNHVGLTTSFILNQKENAEFRFATNNTQRATFMGDGKYGIGPAFSAPSEGFHYQWQNAIFEADDNQSAMISGYLGLKNLNDAAYELRFYEPDGCGQNYSAFKAQNQPNSLVYTLPSLTPAVNDVLSVTNVAGSEVSLTWVTPGGGGGGSPVTGTGTPGEIAFWATPTGISSDSRLYWDDATLRFGVGTATPDDMVDVQGNVFITNGSTAASKLKLGEPNYVGGGNFTSFEAQAQAADVTYILPAAGPVSATAGTNNYSLLTNSIGNTATLQWQPVWATNGNAGVSTGFLGTTDAQPLAFRANNVERARITSAGQTLIGLAADYTDPIGGTSSLAVAGGGGTRFSIANSSNWMQYTDGTTTALLGHFSGTNFITGTFSNHDYVVRTNNAEKFRITNTGNVGIGQTTPTEKLEILNGNTLLSNSDNTARELRFAEPNASGTNYTAFKAQAQAANISYTLPAADGTSGQVLSTNGTGTLNWTAATAGTTNTASVSTNTLTSTINGVAATANVVTSVSNTSSSNNLSTSINGVVGSNVSIINSNALSISTTNLTSTINGVASTALDIKPAIKTVAWSKDGNSSTSPGTDFIGTTDAQGLVFKTAGSEAFRINTSQNIGIGITAPTAKVEIDGALALKANNTSVTTDNQAVTIGNRSFVKFSPDAIPTNRTITLSNGIAEGQVLLISVTATATNGIELLDTGNVNLAATASLNNGDTLQLLWDGASWNEITRSNN
jgi:hypothetical protein